MRITKIIGRGFEINDSPLFGGPLKVTYVQAKLLDDGWSLDAVEVVEDDGEWKVEQEHFIQTRVTSGAVAAMMQAWEDSMSQTQGPPTIDSQRIAAGSTSWMALGDLRGKDRAEQKRLLESGVSASSKGAKLHVVESGSAPHETGKKIKEKTEPAEPRKMPAIVAPEAASPPRDLNPAPASTSAPPKMMVYPPNLGPAGRRTYGLSVICQMVSANAGNIKEARLLKMAQFTLAKLAEDETMCEMLNEYSIKSLEAEEAAASGKHSCGSGCSHKHHGHHGHHRSGAENTSHGAGEADNVVEP